ncbi:MAG: flippase-like domain-containing protein, partial [Firmicutes bacterium]|nr:flippase-like domain-containing protein [Bacillota bacterium]
MKGNNCKAIIKNLIWTAVSAALAVLTVKMVLKQSEDLSVSELIAMINSSDKFFFILGAAAAVMYIWLESVAVRSILKNIGYKQSPLRGLLYSTSDVYFSAVTPSATGGQPASAFFMIRDGIPAETAAAVLVLNLMMYTVSIVVLGVIAVIIKPDAFAAFNTFSRALINIGFLVLTVLSALFFLLLKKGEAMTEPASKFITFLYNKKIIREKDRKLARLEKAGKNYKKCSDMISHRKRILLNSFIWNFLQRASQISVPMLIYRSLGGKTAKMAAVFSKQCLVTIGYNFVPIPGGIGISDYLMLDAFGGMMGANMSSSVELISRSITFYLCVLVCGFITLLGYFLGRNK